MKWFQHQSDASDDIKIKRLERKFGLQGYAIFFKILEKVAKEGEKFAIDARKFPIDDMSLEFSTEKKLLEQILTEMVNLNLITNKKGKICVPNMKKYASNWIRRNDVGTTENLQSAYRAPTAKEENRIEEIRKEEKKARFVLVLKTLTEWNARQSSPIKDFKPEHIVNKHGADKVLELIEQFGKVNGGFSQFMAALKP